jgi:7-cyano-7-deazaguanine synthase
VVLLSGGLDSTVLAAYLQWQQFDVHPLIIFYGQRHAAEMLAARAVADHYKWSAMVVDASTAVPFLQGTSSQVGDTVPVPEGHYADASMKATVVPGRNLLFLAIANSYAAAIKAGTVAYAAHGGDHAIYPDCRPQFVAAAGDAIYLSDYEAKRLYTPFLNKDKTHIVTLGKQIAAPMHLTYSCYKGELFHCGVCGTCVERREAFALAKVPDPTTYTTP